MPGLRTDSSLKVSIRQSVVTPLIKQAVKLHGYSFFYLYPSSFSFRVNKNDAIEFSINPFNWKLIPWLLSITIVTGILGWGSCVYICTFQFLGFHAKPWLHWNLFNTLIILGLGMAASLEMSACIVLRLSPQVFHAFSSILKLEQSCKPKIFISLYILFNTF